MSSHVDYKHQLKVQNIALWCIGLHLIGLVGEIIQFSTSKYNHSTKYDEVFQRRTIISIIMESLLGLLTCILLYIGAKKKNKFLLIPFMLVMVLLQVFLVITLFLFGMLCLSGDPIIFFGMALIMVLLSLTAWMLKATRAFYNEIRDSEGTAHVRTEIVGADVLPYTEVNQSSLDADIEANNVAQQVQQQELFVDVDNTSRQIRMLNRINQTIEAPRAPPEPPPAYNEASIMPNDRMELPPSYDDAMAMRKKDLNEDHD